MKKSIIRLCLAVFAILFVGSCQDQYNICNLPKTVTFRAGLYDSNTGAPKSATSFSLALVGASNFIYDQSTGLSKFEIALNPLTDSAKFYIKVSPSQSADTLTLWYTSQDQFISADCGNVFVHMLTKAKTTHHTIDSVRIINTVVNTTSSENLKVYFP